MKLFRSFSFLVISAAIVFAPFSQFVQPALALAAGCTVSAPTTGSTVTVCLTSPVGGSILTGNASVIATVSLSLGAPRVQRVVFYLDGIYLLTDYQSPYVFTLPTAKWIDGAHTLSAEVLMSTGFVSQRASLPVTFMNQVTVPPVNTNQFHPATGTLPSPGTSFTVAVGGDGASGETNAGTVSDLVASLNPNLFIYLGDVYEKGSLAEFYNWYGSSTNFFGRFRSITNPTIGNHEYLGGVAPGYFDYWDNIPSYYSYNAGGWHFISLNSNSAFMPVNPLSAQYKWLQQDLAANAGVCTIAYYHHPIYNIGPEGSKTSMSDIWNLLAQNGVEIVLNGHDHTYQRWVPLNGSGLPDPNGITEFVAGASGHGLQTITKTDSRVAFSIFTNPTAFGVLLLQLNPDGAHFSYRSSSGSVLDSGAIPCNSSGPDTKAPTVPSGLTATAASATAVNVAWTSSSDNVGVVGYSIYRNGTLFATVSGTSLTYSDTTALPSTSYSYSVDAFDQAGNHSAISAPAQVTTPAMPASVTFFSVADTYVNAGSPATSFGSALTMRTDASPDLHAYLRFNVTGLGGTPITKATLKVFSSSSSSQGIRAFGVADNTWSESGTNYNTAPALGSQLASSATITTGTWVSLDVTPYVTSEGSFNFGLTTPSTTSLSFASRETGANAPQLVISFQANNTDTQPPTTPGSLAAIISGSQVNLSWTASSDNLGVAGYTVFRNGVSLATVSGVSLSCSDLTALPATPYQYSVDAFDQAGNHSTVSAPVAVTITAADTQAPSIPSGLTASAITADTVNVAWAASSDNVGVAGYTVIRNGVSLATVSGTTLSYSDTTALPATSYSYTVEAFDQAGNHSAASAPAQVTTPPATLTSLTFLSVADTYVNAGSPTAVSGSATTLRVDASPDIHSYLRFTVTGLGGKTISRARLLIFPNSNLSQGIKALAVADNTWSEAATNYNNAPALGSLLATSPAITTSTWVSLDVTPYITGEGSFNFGISTDSATALSLASRETGANAPQLILDLQ